MSDKDKQELSKNLKDMKRYKDWFCDTVKEKMKEKFIYFEKDLNFY